MAALAALVFEQWHKIQFTGFMPEDAGSRSIFAKQVSQVASPANTVPPARVARLRPAKCPPGLLCTLGVCAGVEVEHVARNVAATLHATLFAYRRGCPHVEVYVHLLAYWLGSETE